MKPKFAKVYEENQLEKTISGNYNHFCTGLTLLFGDTKKDPAHNSYSPFRTNFFEGKALEYYNNIKNFLEFAVSEANEILDVKNLIIKDGEEASRISNKDITHKRNLFENNLPAFYEAKGGIFIADPLSISWEELEEHPKEYLKHFFNPGLDHNFEKKKFDVKTLERIKRAFSYVNSIKLKQKFGYILEDRNFSILRHMHNYSSFLYSSVENLFKLACENQNIPLNKKGNFRKNLVNKLKNENLLLGDYLEEKFYSSEGAKVLNELRNPLTHSLPSYKILPVFSNNFPRNGLSPNGGRISNLLMKFNDGKIYALESLLKKTQNHVLEGVYDSIHLMVLGDKTEIYKSYLNYLSSNIEKPSFLKFKQDTLPTLKHKTSTENSTK